MTISPIHEEFKPISDEIDQLSPYDEFKDTLGKQAVAPPGNDISIGACYEATLDLLNSPRDPESDQLHPGQAIEEVFKRVSENRKISPQYMTNLYLRCLQHMQIRVMNNSRYPDPEIYGDAMNWYTDIVSIMSDDELSRTFEELLHERDTTTTQYQRYLGPSSIMKKVFGNKEIRIADFGCSIMDGLKGLVDGREFETIHDGTPDKIVERSMEEDTDGLHIVQGYGFDKYDPYDPQTISWEYVCQYPKEIYKSGSFEQWKQSRSDIRHDDVNFIPADLTDQLDQTVVDNIRLDTTGTTREGLDAVTMITFLYQLNEDQQAQVLQNARRLLNEDGIIIVQDFARNHPENGELVSTKGVDWTAKNNPYRLFFSSKDTEWKFIEVLCWDNGRCTNVQACSSEGYQNFMEIASQRSS